MGELSEIWTNLKWFAAGLVLIAIGISQAIYGWFGDSLLMRILYSSACIIFGSAILVSMCWALFADSEEPTDENPDREAREED